MPQLSDYSHTVMHRRDFHRTLGASRPVGRRCEPGPSSLQLGRRCLGAFRQTEDRTQTIGHCSIAISNLLQSIKSIL
jgi:hypothetical protein